MYTVHPRLSCPVGQGFSKLWPDNQNDRIIELTFKIEKTDGDTSIDIKEILCMHRNNQTYT